MYIHHIKKKWLFILVVIAIIAIFIPLIFTRSDLGKPHIYISTYIPDAPKDFVLPKTGIKNQTEIQQVLNGNIPKLTNQLNTSSNTSYIAKSQAYIVQVTSLTNIDSANAMVLRLQQHGFNAFLQTISQKNQVLYRVLIGPIINRNDAVTIQQQLKSIVNNSAIIVNFNP